MHYRAEGTDWISGIGYAASSDGVHWNRLREPILAPKNRRDSRGMQDPVGSKNSSEVGSTIASESGLLSIALLTMVDPTAILRFYFHNFTDHGERSCHGRNCLQT